MIRTAYCYTNADEANRSPTFSFVVDEITARCLAVGAVTGTLQKAARELTEWSLEDIADDAARKREQSSRSRAAERPNAKGAQARPAKGAGRGDR